MDSRAIVLWMVAFLAFPVGGGVGYLAGSKLTGIASIAISAVIAGVTIGVVQFLALRELLDLKWHWAFGTAGAFFAAAIINHLIFGFTIDYTSLLMQGVITGLFVGATQWLLAKSSLTWWWVVAVVVSWPLAWLVTKNIGVDLTEHWAVFGASGGIVYQVLTIIALLLMKNKD